MAGLSHSTAFLIGIIIMVIFLSIYVLKSKGDVQTSRFYVFMSLLAGIASLFIALNLYYQAKTQEETDKRYLANSTIQIIKDLWLTPNKYMSSNYDEITPGFVSSLYLDQDVGDSKKSKELYLSILIFQIFEDYKTIYSQDNTGLYVWLNNFLQWAQSDMLKNNWNRLYHNFKHSTIEFGNFLFQSAQNLKDIRVKLGRKLLPEDYQKLVKQIEGKAIEILEKSDKEYDEEYQ